MLAVGDRDVSGTSTVLYRVSDGTPIRTLTTGATGLAFTPGGKMLAVSSGNNIKLYRLSDGILLQTLPDIPAA